MPRNNNFDVVIIGAGSIGTPAALALASTGLKTLVLDKFPSVGQGSNKSAIGGLRATHSDPAKIRLSIRSLEIFSTWKERYGDNIEWRKGGYCFVVYREKDETTLKDLLINQKKHGLKIDWLGPDEMLKVVPDLNPVGLRGGTYSPDDGHASPLLAIHAFYKQAVKQGVIFNFNENVSEIKVTGGRSSGVITDRAFYGAGVVINAAGPWAAELSKPLGIDLPVLPDSHEGAVTEPVSRFFEAMVVDIRPATGSANFYFYQHDTGQLLFCLTPEPNIWGTDIRETSAFLPMVSRRLLEIMPRLKNLRVRRTWRGLYPMTPDGFPLVGWSREVEGYLLAVGMCGQGFMLGPGLGELIARMILKKTTKEDEESLSYLDPYRKFKSEEKLK